jgi:hypothetical protein
VRNQFSKIRERISKVISARLGNDEIILHSNIYGWTQSMPLARDPSLRSG